MPTTEIGSGLARRGFCARLGALGLVAAFGRPALAQGTSAASAFVTNLAAELTQLVNSGSSAPQVSADFERILARYADMPAIAASVLGPPWRSASNAQKRTFVAAFQHYISRKYGAQFREFKGARIAVAGARDAGRSGVLVSTTVLRPGRETVNVDWQVSDRSGAIKVVNLIIEGVSLLANERAEVGAMLDAKGGSLDALISALAART